MPVEPSPPPAPTAPRVAGVSPPTALSLTWGLEDDVAELSRAVKAGG